MKFHVPIVYSCLQYVRSIAAQSHLLYTEAHLLKTEWQLSEPLKDTNFKMAVFK